MTRHAQLVAEATTERTVMIHGHEVAYRSAGEGPVLVLVHGIAGSSRTWARVMADLAETHTVVAPDLLGHGQSAKPRGDYSLGAYASGIRDLLAVLGHKRATFVGHSLGGGVAMQLAYQFPEMCERLVLVGSGGLGKEVNPLLRLIAVPGSEYILPVVLTSRLHGLAGQRVSARDRLYLAGDVPTLIVWGSRDQIIPAEHGRIAHQLIPGSRLEIIEGAGHFVASQEPERFVAILEDFCATTEPARTSAHRWHELLMADDAPHPGDRATA